VDLGGGARSTHPGEDRDRVPTAAGETDSFVGETLFD
jgi:hypothetical protein